MLIKEIWNITVYISYVLWPFYHIFNITSVYVCKCQQLGKLSLQSNTSNDFWVNTVKISKMSNKCLPSIFVIQL